MFNTIGQFKVQQDAIVAADRMTFDWAKTEGVGG